MYLSVFSATGVGMHHSEESNFSIPFPYLTSFNVKKPEKHLNMEIVSISKKILKKTFKL